MMIWEEEARREEREAQEIASSLRGFIDLELLFWSQNVLFVTLSLRTLFMHREGLKSNFQASFSYGTNLFFDLTPDSRILY